MSLLRGKEMFKSKKVYQFTVKQLQTHSDFPQIHINIAQPAVCSKLPHLRAKLPVYISNA